MIPIRRRAALALGAVALLARPARAGTKGLWQELTASADGTIPDTRCQRVFPAQHPGWGTIGPNGVFIAWNGGAFDTKRNRFTIMGGGHGDYGGNEVYGFDMAARTWARLTEPSPLAPHPTSPGNWVVQGNEAPLTRHTFGSIAYIPQIDRLAVCSGVSFGSGNIGPDPRLWLWNPDDGTWTAGPPAPATSGNGVGMVVTDDEVLHWGQFNAFARYTIALPHGSRRATVSTCCGTPKASAPMAAGRSTSSTTRVGPSRSPGSRFQGPRMGHGTSPGSRRPASRSRVGAEPGGSPTGPSTRRSISCRRPRFSHSIPPPTSSPRPLRPHGRYRRRSSASGSTCRARMRSCWFSPDMTTSGCSIRRVRYQYILPPFGTVRSNPARTTLPPASGQPRIRISERNGPIWRGAKLSTART